MMIQPHMEVLKEKECKFMRDFIMAALPLVVAGGTLAVFFAGRSGKKKKRGKESGYEGEGMSLGMCFGAAVGSFFPEYIGVTLVFAMAFLYNKEKGSITVCGRCL